MYKEIISTKRVWVAPRLYEHNLGEYYENYKRIIRDSSDIFIAFQYLLDLKNEFSANYLLVECRKYIKDCDIRTITNDDYLSAYSEYRNKFK